MSRAVTLGMLLVLGAAIAVAQDTEQATPQRPANAVERASQRPTEADVYCAGYFSRNRIEPAVIVMSSLDVGMKFELGTNDLILLSKPKGSEPAMGSNYMLVRPVRDINPKESFHGQHEVIRRMGTLYAEIARIQVQEALKDSVRARVFSACQPVLAGDIAIPLNEKAIPPFQPVFLAGRFAPSSGKATGVIGAIKDFQESAGKGDIAYVSLGTSQGLKAGTYLRIYRTSESAGQELSQEIMRNYATDSSGISVGRRLSAQEIESLPHRVVGEMIILSAEEGSATGMISYSWEEVSPGDLVEIE